MTTLEYTEIPDRLQGVQAEPRPSDEQMDGLIQRFADVRSRSRDEDGDTEVLDGVSFTHRFVDAPGDYESIRWHYVEGGEGEPIVFLHGLPTSWFQWAHQMAALSTTHRCIAVDLKGYGQSCTEPGDYRHEGCAEQLWAMLRRIGVTTFNLVTHDRGSAQADFLVARHPEAVLRYGRGEQHLYHFNPALARQGDAFRRAPSTGIMKDPKRFVLQVFAMAAKRAIPHGDMTRIIQEYSYPGIIEAVPRYFASSTFRQEWLARREGLLAAWRCPVMTMQGYDSGTQPREWYEQSADHIPNAAAVQVRFIPGGHFWPIESPAETTAAIREMLAM